MPMQMFDDPQVDLDRLDTGAAAMPTPQSDRYAAEFGPLMDFSNKVVHFGQHLVLDTLGMDPADPVRQGDSFGDVDTRISSEDANDRFGVEGYKRFNAPVTEDDAAWQSAQARQQQFKDIVLSRTKSNPLLDFGSSIAGTLLDPAGLGLMALGGPLEDLALGVTGVRGAAESALAVSKVGRLANFTGTTGLRLTEGALANAPYAAANAFISQQTGGDYGYADALRDIAAGAVFHTSMQLAGRGLGALLRSGRGAPAADVLEPGPQSPEGAPPASRLPGGLAEGPEAMVPAEGVPPEVSVLSPVARIGAFVKALEDMADDRPVDVGQYIQREIEQIAKEQAQATPTEHAAETPAEPAQAAPRADGAVDGGVQAERPSLDPARQMLTDLADRYARNDPGDLDVRPPGRAAEPEQTAGRAPFDLRADEAPPPGPAEGSAGKGEGGEPAVASRAPRATAEQIIAGDPELKAIQVETDRLQAVHAVEVPAPKIAARDLAEGIRAAAVCLAGELG